MFKQVKNGNVNVSRILYGGGIVWPDKEFAEYYLNAASLNLKIEASTREAGIYEDGYYGDAPESGYFTGNYPRSIPGYPDVEISYGEIATRYGGESQAGILYNQYLPVTLRLKGTNYVVRKTCATSYWKEKMNW